MYVPENVQGILIFTIFKSDLLIHPPLSSTKGQYSRWQATDLRVIQLVERGLTELYYSLPTWSGDLTAPVSSLCLRVCLIWVCVILEVVESFGVKLRHFFYKLLILQPTSEYVVPLAKQVHIGATFVGLDWSSKLWNSLNIDWTPFSLFCWHDLNGWNEYVQKNNSLDDSSWSRWWYGLGWNVLCNLCSPSAVCFPTSPSAQSTGTYRLLLPLLNIVLCTQAPTKTYVGKFPAHTYLLIVQGYTFLHCAGAQVEPRG